jgi:glycosyltransferase involved in cell wall biosynthesis
VLVPLTVLSVSYPLAKVSPGTAGGAEQVLLTLDKGLLQAGHKSLVLAPEGSRCSGLLIPARITNGILDQNAKRTARQTFKGLLSRTLSQFHIDVVHMHGIDFLEYLPHTDIPVVVSLHLPLEWYPCEKLSSPRSNVTLVSVSHFQSRNAPGACRIDRVIPNGVDLEEFRPTRKQGDYVLGMGRFCPEKGLHLAIEAAERAAAPLILAGAVFEYSEHRRYFDSLIAPRAIAPKLNQRIRLVGSIGGKHKRFLLTGAKCVLIPSQVQETSSLLAMEAMACGTPVIAWRSGALPEIVSHERTGFLVDSVDEMAEAIAHTNDIDRAACRLEAELRFDAHAMVAHYICLYESLAGRVPNKELVAA